MRSGDIRYHITMTVSIRVLGPNLAFVGAKPTSVSSAERQSPLYGLSYEKVGSRLGSRSRLQALSKGLPGRGPSFKKRREYLAVLSLGGADGGRAVHQRVRGARRCRKVRSGSRTPSGARRHDGGRSRRRCDGWRKGLAGRALRQAPGRPASLARPGSTRALDREPKRHEDRARLCSKSFARLPARSTGRRIRPRFGRLSLPERLRAEQRRRRAKVARDGLAARGRVLGWHRLKLRPYGPRPEAGRHRRHAQLSPRRFRFSRPPSPVRRGTDRIG